MKRGEWERFDRSSTDAFLRVLGASVLACAACDAWSGTWRVHAGALFPWRHLPGAPLYGLGWLVLEWTLDALAGAALLAGRARSLAVSLALAGTAMGLSQRFSNHRSLLLIVLGFVALRVPSFAERDFEARDRPNLALVRAQLLLVYAFSVLNKLAHGFLDGASLVTLFGWSPGYALVAAWGVMGVEIAIPALLVSRPPWGIALAVTVHLAMAALLPNVLPFSLVMIAMSLVFVAPRAGKNVLHNE